MLAAHRDQQSPSLKNLQALRAGQEQAKVLLGLSLGTTPQLQYFPLGRKELDGSVREFLKGKAERWEKIATNLKNWEIYVLSDGTEPELVFYASEGTSFLAEEFVTAVLPHAIVHVIVDDAIREKNQLHLPPAVRLHSQDGEPIN
jgi:hypothetical protein